MCFGWMVTGRGGNSANDIIACVKPGGSRKDTHVNITIHKIMPKYSFARKSSLDCFRNEMKNKVSLLQKAWT